MEGQLCEISFWEKANVNTGQEENIITNYKAISEEVDDDEM